MTLLGFSHPLHPWDRVVEGGARHVDVCTLLLNAAVWSRTPCHWGAASRGCLRENNRKMPLPSRVATGWPRLLCRAHGSNTSTRKRKRGRPCCLFSFPCILSSLPSLPPSPFTTTGNNTRKRHSHKTQVLLAPISTPSEPAKRQTPPQAQAQAALPRFLSRLHASSFQLVL